MPIITQSKSCAQDVIDAKRKHFTKTKFVWIDQVMRDKLLLSSAKVVVYVISQHINIESGEAFPSTETIAEWGGLAPSCVRKALKALADSGHLEVQWGKRGRGHPNRYRMIIKPGSYDVSAVNRKWQSGLENKPLKCAVSDDDGDKPHSCAVLEILKPLNEDSKPHFQHHKTAQVCHEPIITKLKKERGRSSTAPTASIVVTAECNKPASDTVSDERGAEEPAIAPTGNAEHGSEALQSEDCVLDGILFLRLCDEIRDHERDEVLMAYALTRNAGYTADEISDLWQAELDKLYPSHPADFLTYLAESSNTGTAGPIKENDHSIAADAGPLSQNEGGRRTA